MKWGVLAVLVLAGNGPLDEGHLIELAVKVPQQAIFFVVDIKSRCDY